MTIGKAVLTPRLIFIAALALLPNLCFGRAEIYARPSVQYTWLPTSGRNADDSGNGLFSFGGGGAVPFGPLARVDNHTLSSGSPGIGLAVGVVLGKDRQCEVGVEGTLTRYNCTYTVTPLAYYPVGSSTKVEPGPAYTGNCKVLVRTVQATFRQYFGKYENRVRPYAGCFLGTLDANFSGKNLPSGTYYYDHESHGYHLATGLSGGAIFKLGNKTFAEAGYRFLYSSEIDSSKGLYRNAHIIHLALNQRF